jgi:hypothetical protein
MLASVSGQISLPVAVNIQPPDHSTTLHRLLPNACVDRPSPPGDIARKAGVDGYQHGHKTIFSEISGRSIAKTTPAYAILPMQFLRAQELDQFRRTIALDARRAATDRIFPGLRRIRRPQAIDINPGLRL